MTHQTEAARVDAALKEIRLLDRLSTFWQRARFAFRALRGPGAVQPPWELLEAPRKQGQLHHTTRIFSPPGQYEGDEDRYDVECDLCGWLAAADSIEQAECLIRLHEAFVATLVEKWSVDR